MASKREAAQPALRATRLPETAISGGWVAKGRTPAVLNLYSRVFIFPSWQRAVRPAQPAAGADSAFGAAAQPLSVGQSAGIGGKTMGRQWLFATMALILLLVGCNQLTISLTPMPTDISLMETPVFTPTPISAPTTTSFPSQIPTERATVALSNIAGTPTPTPMFTDFELREWSSPSPDGEWIAQVIAAFPAVSGMGNYYTQLKVSKADGTLEWVVVDEWLEWGLGYTIPQPLQWSRDGRYLYFTNQPVPDGCAVFVNGADLHRVDLSNGGVRELVPSVGLWLSLSRDETMLAYVGYGDRGLVIRDLVTGAERETKLDPGQSYQAGNIIWSPDGTALILTLALQPCSTDWADSTSIIRVETTTLEQTTLIREDKRLFITVEWSVVDKVLLRDRGDDYWLMDATTGQVTKK